MKLTIKQFLEAKKDKNKKAILEIILNRKNSIHDGQFSITKEVVDVTSFNPHDGFRKFTLSGNMEVQFLVSNKKKRGKK